jgi:hypothetical protein
MTSDNPGPVESFAIDINSVLDTETEFGSCSRDRINYSETLAEDGVFSTRKDDEGRDLVLNVKKVVFGPLFHIDYVTLVDSIPLIFDVDHARSGDDEVEFVSFVGRFWLGVGVPCKFDAQRVLAQYFQVVRVFLFKLVD